MKLEKYSHFMKLILELIAFREKYSDEAEKFSY